MTAGRPWGSRGVLHTTPHGAHTSRKALGLCFCTVFIKCVPKAVSLLVVAAQHTHTHTPVT